MLTYGSICSGVAPQTNSWTALGARASWFSEIEAFPSAVLNYRFPEVPNLGDFTKIGVENGGAIELLVGGTPCQAFSVAGKRAGLDDPRGNLTLEFVRLAARLLPGWILWENVPGVLSIDDGRTFAEFLGLLSGRKVSVPKEGWRNSGIIPGIPDAYGLAYRVLDAQYFGVPQRRRRVFVVGHLGDWRAAAAVLFERHSLSGNPAPSREAGKRVAPCLEGRAGERSGGYGQDRGSVFGAEFAGRDCGRGGYGGGLVQEVAGTLGTHKSGGWGHELDNSGAFIPVAHSLRGEGFDASEEGTGRGIPLVASSGQANAEIAVDQCPTLNCLHEAPIVAFSAKDHGADASEDVSPTLRAGGFDKSHANSGNWMAVAFHARQDPDSGPVTHPLDTDGYSVAVAFQTRVARNGRGNASEIVPALNGADAGATSDMRPCVATGMAVRRLTPRECERLQGMKDDFTLVPIQKRNKKAELKELQEYDARVGNEKTVKWSADGPRYKAIGNSWAVPVLNWIMERILLVDEVSAC